jgi:imidazolonepropionase-like amidohydrolase
MTPDQAIRAVTIDAALSARMANKIGSIWKAQLADPPD